MSSRAADAKAFELLTAFTEFQRQHGTGALHVAVRQKKREIMREFLCAGSNVNAIHMGKTALADAVERDDTEAVEALLAAKADPCARDEATKGASSLHVACEKGLTEMVEKLLAAGGTKGIDDFAADQIGYDRSPLMTASCRGDLRTVETLIAAKAEIDKRGPFGRSAASQAASRGQSTVLEALLKAGADVLQRDEDGRSLVFCAAWTGVTKCLQLLIEAKACVLTPNDDGYSPLSRAAFRGSTQAVRVLIEAKADANSPNNFGETPLHFAATFGKDEVIKVLVIEGQAKLDIKDNDEKTPLKLARPGSSTHALLTEMELTGADEHVLIKGAAKRFKPL